MAKDNSSKPLSPLKSKQLYLLLEYLRDHTFCDYRLTSNDIFEGLLQTRPKVSHDEAPSSAEKEWQSPSKTAIKGLLDNTPDPSELKIQPTYIHNPDNKPDSQKKSLDRGLEFVQNFTANRSLVSFRIVQHDKDDLERMALDDNNKMGYYHLTYSYDPTAIGMKKEDFTSDDYLHQISARWQYTLDLICDFPYISSGDAEALHNILSNLHTLGEIPKRNDHTVKSESINFEVLSRILRPLHKAYKHKSINGENYKIPLLRITMGTYVSVDGKLTLAKGIEHKVYPVCTCVWNGIYYLGVRFPNKKEEEPRYDYLRIDHILDCESLAGPKGKNTILYNDLGTPPSIEQLKGGTKRQFTLTNCSDSTLIEIIDTFGKSCISSAKKENDFWSFDIIIRENREKKLYALHDEQYIHPCRTGREKDTSAVDYAKLLSPGKELWEQFKDTLKPSNIDITTDTTASENDIKLIPAIQSRNREEILHILEDRTEMFDPDDTAWIGYTAIPLDADIYEKLLTFFPKDCSFIVHLPAFPPLLPAGSFSLVSVAAFYNRPDIMKLLIEHGASPNREDGTCCSPLATAIEYGSTECVEYLLTLDNLNKELTDELLQALAKAGSNEKISVACAIAAPELLGCQLVKDHYTPFPKEFALRHVAQSTSLLALVDFCSLHTEELTVNDAEMITKRLPLLKYAEDILSSADIVLNFLFQACPPLLETEAGRYIALVAALHPVSFHWGAELLKKIKEPKIVLLPCLNHNWFGDKGMLTRWDKVSKKINKHRKTPLQLVIDRNKDLPCDPDKINKQIMDTILSDFEIVGDTPQGELSKLATYALKFASVNEIRDRRLLEEEDQQALKAYRSDLEEFSSIPATRSKEIVELLKNTNQN